MQLNRCPICHSRISLEALAQDEAGRELLGLLAKLDTDAGTALVGYLGLFRSAHRDLANDKALKLAKEVMALSSTPNVTQAMRQTVDSLQAKASKPLTNHNYLKKVLDDVVIGGVLQPEGLGVSQRRLYQGKPSGTELALQALEDFGNG